jgi:integrase/recombinase XerD
VLDRIRTGDLLHVKQDAELLSEKNLKQEIGALIEKFFDFQIIDLKRSERTAKEKVWYVKKFLSVVTKNISEISRDDIRSYLKGLNGVGTYTYANTLKSLKVFFRDFLNNPTVVETFRFPRQNYKPKNIPSKDTIRKFYESPSSLKEKAPFLLYASSGLRRMEVLNLSIEDIDSRKKMVKPKPHSGDTKKAWLSFFNEETSEVLQQYLESRKDNNPRLFPMSNRESHSLWNEAKTKTGLTITPQRLREWFCCEMVSRGVSDSYVDSFCGRIPSILAKHYLDYSPERMKKIYDKANLKVLE